MLLISCHILYTCHFLLGFMSAYTLEADTENYKGPKALYSLYETVVYKGPKALLSLYETMISICMTQTGRYNDQNGIYIIDPNGALIYVNCMLQQLYPYRHAYLSLYQVLSRQSSVFYIQ